MPKTSQFREFEELLKAGSMKNLLSDSELEEIRRRAFQGDKWYIQRLGYHHLGTNNIMALLCFRITLSDRPSRAMCQDICKAKCISDIDKKLIADAISRNRRTDKAAQWIADQDETEVAMLQRNGLGRCFA